MSRLLLVDAGNTRTKIGVAEEPVRLILRETAFDPAGWAFKLTEAIGPPPWRWVVSGVNPARVREVADWAASRGEVCRLITDYREVPITIENCEPSQIGIDRLLDVLAATERKRADVPAITVDAGTALVVNCVSAGGAFLGGAIAPGLTVLFAALHAATAKLPRVAVDNFDAPAWPGTTTVGAIHAGCHTMAIGGLTQMLARAMGELTDNPGDPVDLFVTGGDAARFAAHMFWPASCRVTVVETLTLEGLMLAAANT